MIRPDHAPRRFARAMRGLAALFLTLSLTGAPEAQELRGHGGPVRAIAVDPAGEVALTGSFDTSAIRWRLASGVAEAVLRAHDGSVNAAVALGEGRFATGGEDGRIAIWPAAGRTPERVIVAHEAPIVALTAGPDGTFASAAWDGTAALWSPQGEERRRLRGHQGNVNGVAFVPAGGLVTSGYDATLRLWPQDPARPPVVVTLPTPLNGVVVAPDGEIVVAGADGKLHFVSATGEVLGEREVGPTPLIALALSPDGKRVAAGGIRGDVAIIERSTRAVVATLVGPGLPVWSLAFSPDGGEIFSGGGDRMVRRWDARTGEHIGAVIPQAGEDPLAAFSGERGAEVFRACAACHTLTPDGGNRAGPTLYGIFGRRIASAPGYDYSPALRALSIVWSGQTIARLFEIGPNAYLPGTKMPEQRVTSEADRQALVDFLRKATAPR
ncbi:WD-40 repeat-containing protein [Chelatococcus sambhunathii]|uniref:WD-40 repeat-containing protein n=1 Tax=Chelatococcus sambhunathii TaxID=363953 RepID=A0ABP2A5X8_9HYPH|nr:c-type cytochrome [Chelatococcus sambhunathii]CUA89356.1 WD-40 repeat-containing protein [Chelatococcus sambhunathii]